MKTKETLLSLIGGIIGSVGSLFFIIWLFITLGYSAKDVSSDDINLVIESGKLLYLIAIILFAVLIIALCVLIIIFNLKIVIKGINKKRATTAIIFNSIFIILDLAYTIAMHSGSVFSFLTLVSLTALISIVLYAFALNKQRLNSNNLEVDKNK